VLGHGLNTFMAHYLDYWVGGQRLPRYAHNCYLQVAAETGILGLAAFLWLLGALGARLFRALRGLPSKDRLLLSGVCAGLLAFVVQAGIDTNFYSLRQAALFWTLAGLALGVSERGWRAAPPPAPSSGR
jgi:putative inorganic carbon (HCO3(-)) transporter